MIPDIWSADFYQSYTKKPVVGQFNRRDAERAELLSANWCYSASSAPPKAGVTYTIQSNLPTKNPLTKF
jgi:hypothetical protein